MTLKELYGAFTILGTEQEMRYGPNLMVHLGPNLIVHLGPNLMVHFGPNLMVHFGPNLMVHLGPNLIVYSVLGGRQERRQRPLPKMRGGQPPRLAGSPCYRLD